MEAEVIKILEKAFENSPNIGFTCALLVWICLSWWFKLSMVGRNQTCASILLASLKVESVGAEVKNLRDFAAVKAIPTITGLNTPNEWHVGTVFLIYWTFVATAFLIKYYTYGIIFASCSLLIMYLAQPANDISLFQVADGLGILSLAALIFLIILSAVKLMLSANRVPIQLFIDSKPYKIIIFAW